MPTVVDLTGVADADLGEAALAQLDPADDIHATAAYRAQLVRVLTERCRSARGRRVPRSSPRPDVHAERAPGEVRRVRPREAA